MPKIESKNYPRPLFLTMDENGRPHCHFEDPMKNGSMENETDLYNEIFNFVGKGDSLNPVIIRFQCAHIQRAFPFSADWVAKIRRGAEKKRFQDRSGANVEIIASMNRSDHPYNGVVVDPEGGAVTLRTYDRKGECSDGDPSHALMVVNDNEPDAPGEGK